MPSHSHHDNTPVRDRIVSGERQRFCKRHHGWWPLRLFVKAKQGRLGFLGYCRGCRKDGRVNSYVPSTEHSRALRRARYRRLVSAGMLPSQARRVA